LIFLIGTPRCPDEIIGLIEDARLPFQAQKAFVGKDVAESEVVDDRLSSSPRVRVGGDQIVHNRDAMQGADGDQFVAKILEVSAGTLSIIGISRKIAMLLVSFIAQQMMVKRSIMVILVMGMLRLKILVGTFNLRDIPIFVNPFLISHHT
jgi:hypothetical protein